MAGRSEVRPRDRCALRPGWLPQRPRAARRARRRLGWHAAAAAEVPRSQVLRKRSEEDLALKVIDVHTHMLNDAYLALLKKHGGGYKVKKVVGGQTGIVKDGAPFMTLMPGMFDYELRIRAMDEARVDMAVVTLTSPNVFWGSANQSLQAARVVNDDMAAQQRRFPDRIRFMCSLPWQHAKLAVAELKHACDELGAVAVMQLANVDGVSLTDK